MCTSHYKKFILKEVKRQIEKEPDIYFENYQALISETFDAKSYYCTSSGIILYYQQYDIAPYSSGIRKFLIPYSRCVLNPKQKCFPLKF